MSISKRWEQERISSDDIYVNNLVVMDFETMTKTRPPEVQDAIETWRAEHQPLYTMSCARQIWYGAMEDFVDFPDVSNDKHARRLEGQEAYAFLTAFATGFEEGKCDTHNRKQFLDAWTEVQRTMPEKAVRAEKLMKALNYDAKTVTNKLTGHLRTLDRMSSACDLSDQKKGDQSLIVAQVSRAGNLTDNSIRLIAAIEKVSRGTSCSDDYICIAHPDRKELDKLRDAVAYTRAQGSSSKHNIRSNIRFALLDDALLDLENFDHVYVDIPMDEDPDMDELLRYAWHEFATPGMTLTHVKGKPSERGMSSDSWVDDELLDYIGPEEINEEVMLRRDFEKLILQRSVEAFELMASLRAQGITPNKTALEAEHSDVFTLNLD